MDPVYIYWHKGAFLVGNWPKWAKDCPSHTAISHITTSHNYTNPFKNLVQLPSPERFEDLVAYTLPEWFKYPVYNPFPQWSQAPVYHPSLQLSWAPFFSHRRHKSSIHTMRKEKSPPKSPLWEKNKIHRSGLYLMAHGRISWRKLTKFGMKLAKCYIYLCYFLC